MGRTRGGGRSSDTITGDCFVKDAKEEEVGSTDKEISLNTHDCVDNKNQHRATPKHSLYLNRRVGWVTQDGVEGDLGIFLGFIAVCVILGQVCDDSVTVIVYHLHSGDRCNFAQMVWGEFFVAHET
ncbi:uncharacterized protein G2W53_016193 [Senna tora]|uniref:Uncharacterized protein n=1 Tax=Senna tora TaxID=362788 RepID=A0A834WWY3_9FABA|nr:uncharacterized protein G2W53_016193 [Senna tora]